MFSLTAIFALEQGITLLKITAVNGFVDTFKNNISDIFAIIDNGFEMVTQNLLQNIHTYNIAESYEKEKPP